VLFRSSISFSKSEIAKTSDEIELYEKVTRKPHRFMENPGKAFAIQQRRNLIRKLQDGTLDAKKSIAEMGTSAGKGHRKFSAAEKSKV